MSSLPSKIVRRGRDVGRKLRHLGRSARGQMHLDFNGDPAKTVLVAGSGRSGTTWIGDIANFRNTYRVMFEPFRQDRVDLARNFQLRQYIDPDDESPRFLSAARRIVTGNVRDSWIDSRNTRILTTARLIKDVRVNLMLKWLRRRFPMMPIVLVLRHPCAVARSRVAAGWQPQLEVLLKQEPLVRDHLHPYVSEIRAAKPGFDSFIFEWCVEHMVALRQLDRGDVFMCFYEDFCVYPEREIRALLCFLGQPYDANALHLSRRPSAVSRSESAIMQGEDLVEGWRKRTSRAELDRANEILEMFELDRVYPGSMPDRREAESLLDAEWN